MKAPYERARRCFHRVSPHGLNAYCETKKETEKENTRRLVGYTVESGRSAFDEEIEQMEKPYSLTIPMPILIQIRRSQNIPSELSAHIFYKGVYNLAWDREVKIAVVRMTDYDLQRILKEDLLFILPFYFVHYEKDFERKALSPKVIQSIKDDSLLMVQTLDQMWEDKKDQPGRKDISVSGNLCGFGEDGSSPFGRNRGGKEMEHSHKLSWK